MILLKIFSHARAKYCSEKFIFDIYGKKSTFYKIYIASFSEVLISSFLKLFRKAMNKNIIKVEESPNVIKEGQAEILEPPGKKVFYNPVQEFNRDLRYKHI